MAWYWPAPPKRNVMGRTLLHGLAIALALLNSANSWAADARIAVAANFRETAAAIAQHLESHSAHRYEIIAGSTGKLAGQIISGAPFDVLMAADERRPQQLVDLGMALPDSRVIYALGELGLWWPDATSHIAIDALQALDPREVCIANPAFAPYGEAAWALLNRSSMSPEWLRRIVRVDNVNLVTGLVAQKQVKAGFIARSSLIAGQRTGSITAEPNEVLWLSDQADIAQALVVMKRARDNEAVQYWVEQLRDEAVRALISRDGYRVPREQG